MYARNEGTYREGMKTLLSCSVPNFISQDAVFQTTFLRKESGAYGWLLVWLELVGDLGGWKMSCGCGCCIKVLRTKRRTTEDFPTAASPA
jgi:hypothetical protein